MTLLAIDWPGVGIKVLQFILSFSILVVLHELGHFLPARWFKCRVEKFYLFFNPWFSLFKKKIGETEYGLGWIPFGGYVKISGMIDESMDKDAMKLPPCPCPYSFCTFGRIMGFSSTKELDTCTPIPLPALPFLVVMMMAPLEASEP